MLSLSHSAASTNLLNRITERPADKAEALQLK
jgi:hypothetical protein